MRIATIINYCSNEQRFINQCLNASKKISDFVLVPVSDHLYDGTPEKLEIINEHKTQHPDVDFLVYPWHNGKPSRYWHNYSRLIAAQQISSRCDWILFLDADEILDCNLFSKFILQLKTKPHINSYKLANYWYFREPIYRAKQIEDSAVIVRSEYSTNINLEDYGREREQFEFYNTPRKVMIENQPMIHHFSWVRNKQEMLQKVKTWGHNNDKNWQILVEEEFSRNFNGKCFVNNYDFDIVENTYEI